MNAQVDLSSRAGAIAQQAVAAKSLAAKFIGNWPSERPFDARALIASHPELRTCRSAVLDLAYEQYCRERETGKAVDRQSFAARFPSHRRTLLNLLDVHEACLANENTIPANAAWPAPGSEFLGFQLGAELGRGSFSRVFLAKEADVGGRDVVVKVCIDAGREAAILGNLQHPHICPVYSVRRDPSTGLAAICMPLLGTQTWMDLMDAESNGFEAADGSADTARHRSAQPAPSRIATMGSQIAAALAYTHARGIVHGDIKPSNILVTDEGEKLIDFNLSTRHDRNESLLGGTLAYMAPEQLAEMTSKSKRESLPATDVYSLGATLFESLTGQLPFGLPDPETDRRAAVDALLRRQADVPNSFTRETIRGLGDMAEIVLRCLAYDPACRPTAAELSELLSSLAVPRRPRGRSGKWKMAVWGGAVLAVAAATAFAVFRPDVNSGFQLPKLPAAEVPQPPAVARLLAAASKAIERKDFAEADRQLSRVPAAERTAQILAAMGYCKARLAETPNAESAYQYATAAIGCFQEAIKKGHPEHDRLLDNIGLCRTIVSRTRPLKFEPTMPPAEFRSLSAKEMEARLRDILYVAKWKRQSLRTDLQYFEFATRSNPHSWSIQVAACEYCAIAPTVFPSRRSEFIRRAVEYAWCAVAASKSNRQFEKFTLSRLAKLQEIAAQTEYARLKVACSIPPVMWYDNKPLRTR